MSANTSSDPIKATAVVPLLYPLQSQQEWADHLARAARTLGFHLQPPSRLWQPAAIRPCADGLRYADGFHCVPIHLGQSHALAIRPHRFYFEGNHEMPSPKTTNQLFPNRPQPAGISPANHIRACQDLAVQLADHGFAGLDPSPITPLASFSDLRKSSHYLLGSQQQMPITAKLSSALMQHGVYRPAADLAPLVFVEKAHWRTGQLYARILQNAFGRMRLSAKVQPVLIPDSAAAQTQYASALIERGKGMVPVIGVPGSTGMPLPAPVTSFINELDKRSICYRLFSVDNPSLQWAGLDQAGIILTCAGGIPYQLSLPWPDSIQKPLLLGLDLGHPRRETRSWLAATLLNANGRLIAAARFRQPRDETIRAQTLQSVFAWIRTQIHAQALAPDGFLVLRDGRLFERESVDDYQDAFGPRLTFADITKNPVPLLTEGDAPSAPGTACVMPSGSMAFLMGSHGVVQDHLPKPVKVHLRHDQLNLGMESLLRILTGLCHAPTLGLRPTRLPAPTYWADGFAAISDTNHQFAGLGHTQIEEPS